MAGCTFEGLTVLTGQRIAESLIDTFVNLSVGLEGIHRGETSFREASQEEGLGFFQRGDGLLTAYARILFQKFIQSFSTLQIVQQGLERDACAAKDGLSAVDVRILDNYALRGGRHMAPPGRVLIISSRWKKYSEKRNCSTRGCSRSAHAEPRRMRHPGTC